MSEQKKVRWGILGAARVNQRLMPAIIEADNAELVGIASRRPGAAAEVLSQYAPENTRAVAFDSLDDVIERDDIDAIYLPMANEEHTDWAIKAIKQGKHVLIEKPMALTVEDIDAITAAAEQANVIVMEGFMYCFHPQHDTVAEIIASGQIGEVRTVKTCFSFPMQPARMYRITRDIDNGGGAMWDIGPYAVHTARKWFDHKPSSVMAMAKLNEHGADVSLTGVLDYDDGRYAHFDMSFERARRSEYEIIGTLGGIKCDTVWQNPDDAPVLHWWTDAGEQHKVELTIANHFVEEIKHFSDCILNGTLPLLSVQDARENCEVINAALKSVKSGQREEIV